MAEPSSPALDAPDSVLIEALRRGDVSAMDALYRRYRPGAERVARALDPERGDDLVAEAFSRVFAAIRSGRGPNENVAGYLASTVRRLNIDFQRSRRRELPASDSPWLLDEEAPEEVVDPIDLDRAGQALSALPENWREVLWYLEVEGRKPAEVAARMGVSAPRVSALAYRAREGLRRSYLDRYVATSESRQCRWTRERLSAYVRDGLSETAHEKVRRHLDICPDCMLQHASLAEVNTRLGVWFWPLAATGFMVLRPELWPKALVATGATGAGAAGTGGTGPRPNGRTLRSSVTTTAGVASGVVVAAAAAALVFGGFGPSTPASDAIPPADAAPAQPSERTKPATEEEPDAAVEAADAVAPAEATEAPALRPLAATVPAAAAAAPAPAAPPAPAPAPPAPAPAPAPGPAPAPAPGPAPGPGPIPGPTEPEEPVEPEPDPALTDLQVGTPTVTPNGDAAWLLNIPVDASYTGALEPTTLEVRIDLDAAAQFLARHSPSWDCHGIETWPTPTQPYFFQTHTCSLQWTPGQEIEPLIVELGLVEPAGTATLSAPGHPAVEPSTSERF